MAESDRKRLFDMALALRPAKPADFAGGRAAPRDADPALLKIIEDTALRTKLQDARLAEGLQSPKGLQKIASIVRIYPAFDAPPRERQTRRPRAAPVAAPAPRQSLPSVDDMERLIARIREVEGDVESELSATTDARIGELKRSLSSLEGVELERAVRELGAALDERRALASHIRHETFKRIERDTDFAPRTFLRLLAR